MKAKAMAAVVPLLCLVAPLIPVVSPVEAGGSKGKVIVVNTGSDTVTLIDSQKREVIADIRVGVHPIKFVTDLKVKFAYVINRDSHDLSIIDLQNLSVLDIPLGFEPLDLAIASKGRILAILHAHPNEASGGEDFKGDYSFYDLRKGNLVTSYLSGGGTGEPKLCALATDNDDDLVWITSCDAGEVFLFDARKALNGDSGDDVRTVLETQSDPSFIGVTRK